MPGMVASDSDLGHMSQQLLSLWPSTMGCLQLFTSSCLVLQLISCRKSAFWLFALAQEFFFFHTSGAVKMGVHGPGFFMHHCQVPQVDRTSCDLIVAEGCRAMWDTSFFPDADIQLLSSGNFSLFLQKLPWLQ